MLALKICSTMSLSDFTALEEDVPSRFLCFSAGMMEVQGRSAE
jgi:hypothetical protein